MAEQDDTLDLSEDDIIVDDDTEQDDLAPEENASEEDDGEDVLVLPGDDDAGGEGGVAKKEPETPLIQQLRKELRERDKLIAASKKQPQAEAEIVVGERPRLADFDYDEDAHDKALDDWEQRKESKRQQDQRREEAGRKQQQQWEQVARTYAEKKKALPFADKQDAEEAAFGALSEVQQSVIAMVADNPAMVVYAAGKRPNLLMELASIDDPLKLARAIGKMEAGMTVKKKSRVAPEPDRPVRGNTVSMAGADKQLAKLEAEADKSGDRSKVIAFKRAQREKQK